MRISSSLRFCIPERHLHASVIPTWCERATVYLPRASNFGSAPFSAEIRSELLAFSPCSGTALPGLAVRPSSALIRGCRTYRRHPTNATSPCAVSRPANLGMGSSKAGKKCRSASVRVITWNIDMNTPSWIQRTRAQVNIVKEMQPPVDIFMVQEVTSVVHTTGTQSVLAVFQSALSNYELHMDPKWTSSKPYFVAIFARRGLFSETPAVQTKYIDFPASAMDRSCLTVEGCLAANGASVAFVTSHLESEKAGTVQRKAQFCHVVEEMRKRARSGTVTVFGGDTNLREGEISAVVVAKKVDAERKERAARADREDERRRVSDAYIQAGADPEEKFTWDCEKNDNLQVDWEFKPRSRYDRVFLFGPVLQFPTCTKWKLVGKEKLGCGFFPSDHWGACADITIPANASSAKSVAKRSSSDEEAVEKDRCQSAKKSGTATSKRASKGKEQSRSTKRRKTQS